MKDNGPWKVKGSEIKYKNKWLEVREDDIVQPDGKDGVYGVVTMMPGVSVLPLDDEGNVHLVDEFKYAVGRYTIATVSGGIEHDDALLTGKQELKEELGIEAREWIDLGTVDPFTSAINSPVNLYLARGLTFGETDHEGVEVIRPVKLSFEEAVKMAMESTITHSPSAALILKAARFLKNEG